MATGGVQIRLDGMDKCAEKLRVRSKAFSERQTKAIQRAATRVATQIEQEGRANIAQGGNFGSARWQQGFRAKISYFARSNLNIRVTHSVFYWKVFEFGARILGKPLLWIPLPWNKTGRRAGEFGAPLFRVNRLGKAPLLLSDDGPQYFGKESVRIPRKWRLRDIVRRNARNLSKFYKEEMKNGR